MAQPPPIIARSNKEFSSSQIADCLAVIGHLAGWLDKSEDPLDAEVQTSLEGTIIRACNRLDGILDDASRWELPAVDGHLLTLEAASQQNQIVAHELFALEFRKQVALGQFTLTEPPPAPKPSRRNRRKK